MNTKLTNVAIVTAIVVISSVANIMLFAPKKANAVALDLQRRTCTGSSTTNGSASSASDSVMTKLNTPLEKYINVNPSWTSCASDNAMSGVMISRLNGGGSADAIQLNIQCCTVTT